MVIIRCHHPVHCKVAAAFLVVRHDVFARVYGATSTQNKADTTHQTITNANTNTKTTSTSTSTNPNPNPNP